VVSWLRSVSRLLRGRQGSVPLRQREQHAALGLAHGHSTLPVCAGHLVGEREDEAPVAFDLPCGRLTLKPLDCLPHMLRSVLLEFLNRVVAGVVELGLRGDNLVEG
jgi:hypothetical protein